MLCHPQVLKICKSVDFELFVNRQFLHDVAVFQLLNSPSQLLLFYSLTLNSLEVGLEVEEGAPSLVHTDRIGETPVRFPNITCSKLWLFYFISVLFGSLMTSLACMTLNVLRISYSSRTSLPRVSQLSIKLRAASVNNYDKANSDSVLYFSMVALGFWCFAMPNVDW